MEYGECRAGKAQRMYQDLTFCGSKNNKNYSWKKRNYDSKVYDIMNNYLQACEYYFSSELKTYDCYTDEELSMSYWYIYYVETLVYRMISAVDLLYHVINEEYKLEVKAGAGFQQRVRKKVKDSDLVRELNKVYKNNGELLKLRNEMMHNVDIAELKIEIKDKILSHSFEYSNNQIWRIITNGLEELKSLKDNIELALEKEVDA